jgi:translation initiation factor IF-3
VAFNRQNYFQRRTRPRGPRINERIRALEVQVIGSDGKNLGTLAIKEAIEMAKQEELDLIEISPKANPPVCKIIDNGKYRYDLQKKANKAKKKQRIINLKEIKLRPVTEIHDYNFKIKNAQKFLEKGDKVKFTVKFRGREMQHIHLGNKLMERIINDTVNVAFLSL